MKLFSSLPASSLLSKHRGLKELDLPCQWKPTLLTADLRSTQKVSLLARNLVPSKAEWVAHRHTNDVEGNHQGSNIEFHETSTSRRYQGIPSICQRPEAPLSLTAGSSYGGSKGKSQKRSSQKACMNIEDLEQLCSEMKRVLCSKGLLKETSIREVAIPGTYLLEDQQISHSGKPSLMTTDSETFFTLATTSKESSMEIQCYISDCSDEDLQALSVKLQPHLLDLISHKFGSFVLQRLLVSYQPSFKVVEQLCTTKFEELIKNEYSSRVIQLLIEKSKAFCDFSISYFRNNLAQAIGMSSSCHLLVASLKNSADKHAGDFILDHLRQKPVLIGNRFFHRVLLTYVHLSTPEQLDEVAAVLGINFKIAKLFNRKATNVILLTMIQRNHQPTIDSICKQLTRNPQQLFETRYFITTMHKLTQEKLTSLQNSVYSALTQLPVHTIDILGKKNESFCQYIYLLLICCSDLHRSNIPSFIEENHLEPQLRNYMGNNTPTTKASQLVPEDSDSKNNSLFAGKF